MTAVEGEKLMRIGDFGAALGMPEATLRAWERRYGIPIPVRTPGGHRLYRASDVEKVVAILRLIREGMTVRAAAAQVKAGTLGGLPVHRTESSWDHVLPTGSTLTTTWTVERDASTVTLRRSFSLVDEAGRPYPILSDDEEEVVLNDKDVASLRWLLGGPG